MNKVRKMVTGGLVLALLGGMLLVGSGVSAKEKVVLEYAHWCSGWTQEIEEAVVNAFYKKYPNIEIKMIVTPWPQQHTKLLTMIAGGTPPDLMVVDAYFADEFFLKGAYLDLKPYIGRDKVNLGLYFPGLIAEQSREGKIYGVPWWWGTIAVGVNRELFEKAGLKYPGPDADWTWDDFLTMGRKLTQDIDDDGVADQFGLAMDMKAAWPSLVWSNGGNIFNDDYTKCTLNEPEAYEAIQWISDLINIYHIAPSIAEASAFGRLGAFNMFQAGQIGMAIAWDINFAIWGKTAKFDFSLAPMPAGKLGSISWRKGNTFGIASLSKHPEEAWNYLKFFLGEEAQRILMENGVNPSMMSLAESDECLLREGPPYDMSPAMKAKVRSIRFIPGLFNAFKHDLDLVYLGKMKAKDACATIASEVDKILKEIQ